MADGKRSLRAGPAALVAGYLMCKGVGAVLPTRWITDYDGSFTGLGATLYWIVFIGTVGVVLHAFGYTGRDAPEQTKRRDDPWY